MRKLAAALLAVIGVLAQCQSDQEKCNDGEPCIGYGTSCTPTGACWACFCESNGLYDCEHANMTCDAHVPQDVRGSCPQATYVIPHASCTSTAPACATALACGEG